MKRNPRKLKWTKAFRKSAGKEMVVDRTLTFAARRNVPTRYSRDLVATTLKAMQRVSEIQARRERMFYKNRMVGNLAARRAADRKLVEENQHMLPEVRSKLALRESLPVEGEDLLEETSLVTEEPILVKLPARSHKIKASSFSKSVNVMDTE